MVFWGWVCWYFIFWKLGDAGGDKDRRCEGDSPIPTSCKAPVALLPAGAGAHSEGWRKALKAARLGTL